MREITELQRAEEAIRQSEKRFRATFEQAAVGIAHVGPDGRWLRVNQKLCDIVGYSHHELMGLTFQDITYPDDLQADLAYVGRLLAGEIMTYSMEKRYIRKDRSLVWINLTVSLARTPQGRPDYFISVVQDITEKKQAEEALKEADRRKDEFLATLAHELLNPLAPIRNALQILRLSPDREAQEQARSMMQRHLEQMVRLVEDLLDVSRITAGKLEIRKRPVCLSEVVRRAVETSHPLIDHMGHGLTVTLPEEPITVDADLARLAQVLSNLLNNSAKYTERGGHIWLTAERQGSDVQVSVKDNGIGIPADQLPRLFQMFSQAERSLDKAQGGLGIGLTLVKRLVEMHGGRVEASSEGSGNGSEFVVRLPAGVEASAPPASAERDEPAPPKSSLRILIVDDNRDGADSLGTLLRIMGNDIRTAYDGQKGVDVAEEFRPNVVLLDIGLPKLNGYEACRRIREQAWGREMVLIAVTGRGQEEDRRRSYEAGFDHHLVKPADPEALMKLLAGLSMACLGPKSDG
jgi:PAS domain S-box-containing protein